MEVTLSETSKKEFDRCSSRIIEVMIGEYGTENDDEANGGTSMVKAI